MIIAQLKLPKNIKPFFKEMNHLAASAAGPIHQVVFTKDDVEDIKRRRY